MQILTGLDYVVLTLIFFSSCSIIIYSQRLADKRNNIYEYLVMGRQLTLPFFVTTLVATWYGGILGVTQIAFEQGIYNFFTQGVCWYLSYIIFAVFLVKKIQTSSTLTLPELITNMYGKNAGKFAAILIYIKTLPVTYAISLGIILHVVFAIPAQLTIIIGVIVFSIYSMRGGLRTVIFADTWNFILMAIGVSMLLIYSVYNFGGLEFLHRTLPQSYFLPTGNRNLSTIIVWFFIACSATFVNPAFYQRCVAAKNQQTAVIGIIIATLIWICFDIATTFGAMYARAVMPSLDSSMAYLTYGLQILPAGLRAVLIASIIATILSTLDSFLFCASNILFYDLQLGVNYNIKIRKLLAALLTALSTILIAIFFTGTIESYWFGFKSYFSACVFIPILICMLGEFRIPEHEFIIITLSGAIIMLWWDSFGTIIPSFYWGCITTIILTAISIVRVKLFGNFKFTN